MIYIFEGEDKTGRAARISWDASSCESVEYVKQRLLAKPLYDGHPGYKYLELLRII